MDILNLFLDYIRWYHFGVVSPRFEAIDNPLLYVSKFKESLNDEHKKIVFETACDVGNLDIINLFIDSENINIGMAISARRGDHDLVQLFIDRGANNWNECMILSCRGGYDDLTMKFIEKGADDCHSGFCSAKTEKMRHYFRQKLSEIQTCSDDGYGSLH
ncbi:Hypothetical protein HVR_LOCUS1360 [uncultured virus]|nr:Hypothetical protein HVR_LOCUS1360 [uncultured virus]